MVVLAPILPMAMIASALMALRVMTVRSMSAIQILANLVVPVKLTKTRIVVIAPQITAAHSLARTVAPVPILPMATSANVLLALLVRAVRPVAL